ncbi:unnamed protein product [Adineta ricciae]|uniref:Uncharacterized protein n=2 Tax=Adineta ricciae TaxID=249248 RepID=A0A813WFK1_ADIRI|nr:unnamed protein product [Adineta ricciae]
MMATKEKQESAVINKQTFKQPGASSKKKTINAIKTPRIAPKLLPYVPPDALMYQLFNAIECKAWSEAKTLCYELVLCDPWRKNYRDLYERIERVIKIKNERRRPRQYIKRTVTANSDSSERVTTNRR